MKTKIYVFLMILTLLATAACSPTDASQAGVNSTAQVSQAEASATSTGQSLSAPTETPATSSTANLPEWSDLETHEADADYTWDENSVIEISLADNASKSSSELVTITGNQITLNSSGTYRLSGTLSDGQILVSTESESPVRLIFNGVNISSQSSAAVNIEKAEKVIIILAEGSQNQLSDASTYIYPSADVDEPNAALFSKTDMSISGSGTLTVQGNTNDAIASKDGLVIRDANITVNAFDDGIRGKDYLVIADSTLSVTSGGDGLKSDNDNVDSLGSIQIISSDLSIHADGDAISAEGLVEILSGNMNIQTRSGSSSAASDADSAKGIKGLTGVLIDGVTASIDTADDAIHSNGTIEINSGNLQLASADDGIHADSALTINGGTIDISYCYEGLESTQIAINNGSIHILASDDGINVAGGADSSGFGGTGWGQPGGRPGEQGMNSGETSTMWLTINGGYVYVSAGGDGLDSNGSIVMNGGTVLVDGPTNDGNGALDYMGSFSINGGLLIAAGSAGMAQAPGETSTQPAILLVFDQTQPAGTLFSLQTEAGEALIAYAPSKAYQSMVISSPLLTIGSTYSAVLGGSSSGSASDGLIASGTLSGGSSAAEVSLSSMVTLSGSNPGFLRPGGRR